MIVLKIAAFRLCLIALVTAASAQNLQRPSAQPGDALSERLDPRIHRNETSRELRLASEYMAGEGVPRNAEIAAQWYRKAADHGDPAAQNQLALLYLAGFGVHADDSEAFKWFARAAGSSFQPAKLNLAIMYMQGRGTARDESLAVQLLRELAEKRNPVAEDYLGIAYFAGMGVNVDHSEAEKWFTKAARQHDPKAEFDMGAMEAELGDQPHRFDRAAAHFRASAKAGYVPAMYSLGLLLLRHPELPRRPVEIESLLQTAAAAGFWRSSLLLGLMARDGSDRAPDAADAYRWFLIAAGQGGTEAKNLLDKDLAACRATLDQNHQAEEKEDADAWLQQHPARRNFIAADRSRKRLLSIEDIGDHLPLTLN